MSTANTDQWDHAGRNAPAREAESAHAEEVARLRAEIERLRDALRNISEETTDATAQEIADRALAGGAK